MSISGGGSKQLLRRIFLGGLVVVVTAAAVLLVLVLLRKDRTFEAPMPSVHTSADPRVIERGRYLAYGPAHCVQCHGDPEALHLGKSEVPFIGGKAFDLPIGTVYTANLTADPVTGIGGLSDATLARALRYGVGRNGHALLPFMPYGDMSDEDLTAVLSFLRTLPPQRQAVPATKNNLLGMAVRAFVLEPRGPSGSVSATVTPGPTAEYGGYLANSVAACVTCHTKLDMATGKRIGAPFAGGNELASHEGRTKYLTPNLTPDPTGWLVHWDEDLFVRRFKAGVTDPGSPMPWMAYARTSEDDLRAIYRYLRTLPPVASASAR